jgi:nitroreductase
MDAMDAILSRRSIRKYTSESITEATLQELLEAAMSAPSAGNEQPWHFVVISDRQVLDEIPKVHPYSQMLREASLAILICGDKTLEKYPGFWVQDCAAAAENLLIAVQAKGLGAVWLGIYPVEERVIALRKLLSIPEHVIPFSLIPVGHPGEKKPRSHRYDSTRIHRNQW